MEDGELAHMKGHSGEKAVALDFEIPWDPQPGKYKKGGDVGPFQVRTGSGYHYDLWVRNLPPDDVDPDNKIWILVTGPSPHHCLIGWMWGFDVKKYPTRDYGKRKKPAHYAPQECLHSIIELRELWRSCVAEMGFEKAMATFQSPVDFRAYQAKKKQAH
jgi:hypothetical protein